MRADVWARLFEAVADEPDLEYAMVDATIVKVHRHGQGAKDPMGRRIAEPWLGLGSDHLYLEPYHGRHCHNHIAD